MKKWISYGVLCGIIPAVVAAGAWLFEDKQYAWISLCVAVLSCLPFLLYFEKKETSIKKMILIAVMTALSVIGRILFAPIPGFKPVTALVVITAMYFGPEAGFMTGALSAVLSNFYFGQGPWTPFQMFSWGIIGFIAGLMAESLKRSKMVLAGYGILSGILFSQLMDIWTVLWADGTFNFSRYLAAMAAAIPFTAVYAISNVIFLLVFAKPIGKILNRIKIKYDLS